MFRNTVSSPVRMGLILFCRCMERSNDSDLPRMAPPASTRISTRLKCVQEHSSPVNMCWTAPHTRIASRHHRDWTNLTAADWARVSQGTRRVRGGSAELSPPGTEAASIGPRRRSSRVYIVDIV